MSRFPAHRRAAVVPVLAALLLLAHPALAQHDHAAMAAAETTPRLELHGFFDVDLSLRSIRQNGADSASAGYRLGQFDLFLNSVLAPRVSFLGELVVEAEDDGGSAIELERAYVRYAFSDRLRVSVGRTHSAVSDWYVKCHHGALLQPTIERPVPVRFEDEAEGGFLPAHAVGVELSGREPLGELSFDWVANVANGRAHEPAVVQTTADHNRDKQLGAGLSLGGASPFEWRAGGAWFHDRIAGVPGLAGEMDQDIASAHLSFRHDWLEQTGELFQVLDRDRVTHARFQHRGWYSVVTAGQGAVRPYAAVEGVRVEAGDVFQGGRSDLDRTTWGLRWDHSASNAFKLEYRNTRSAGARTNELLVQTAFAF